MTVREATVAITVPFHDIDSIGVAWHGHYAKYFEIARCALLDSFGYGYDAMRESGLHVAGDRHAHPLREGRAFGQRILVKATLREWENRLLIDYLVTDEASGAAADQGQHRAGRRRHEERRDVFRVAARAVRAPGPGAMKRRRALLGCASLFVLPARSARRPPIRSRIR